MRSRSLDVIEFDDPKKLTDEELLSAYRQSSGEAGDPISEALLAEIKKRNLDI